jgi:hypothetical protein
MRRGAAAPGCCGCGDLRAAQGRTPLPAVQSAAAGTQCVEPPDVMRRNHMNCSSTSATTPCAAACAAPRHSLKGCIDCHASAQTRSVAQAPGNFCVSCHQYAAVKIDCFECHTEQAACGTLKGRHPMSRRGFRGLAGRAAAGLAGVMLAPGIRLIEIGHLRPRPPAPGCQGALGHADRHHEVRRRLHRLRHRLQHRKRPGRTPQRAPTRAVDPQDRDQGSQDRPPGLGAGDVPALRRAALRGRLPHRRQRSSAPTASCWSTATPASAAATA